MPDINRARTEEPRDAFTGYTWGDWLFVGFLYILAVYLVLQISLQVQRPGEFDFDFMPIVNGALFIWVAWDAVRLKRLMRGAVEGLVRSGAIPVLRSSEGDAVLREMLRLTRIYGLSGAILVGFTMTAGILFFSELFVGGRIVWDDRGGLAGIVGSYVVAADDQPINTVFEFLLLLLVGLLVSTVAGYFLGSMIANGRLLEVLRRLGHDLSGFASDNGVETLRLIETIYERAARMTLALCGVFAVWWLAWRAGIPIVDEYHDWQYPFLALWFIAFAAYLLATYLPVRAFQRRLDEIYGGPEARDLMVHQIAVARSDLASLGDARTDLGEAPRARLARRREDLADFVESFNGRIFRKTLLRPGILTAGLAANLAAFALGLALPGSQTPESAPTQAGGLETVAAARIVS